MPHSLSPRQLALSAFARNPASLFSAAPTRALLLAGLAAASLHGTGCFAQAAGAQTGAAVPVNTQPLAGQAGDASQGRQTGTTSLQGAVLDPDQAEIPGATITLTPVPAGKAKAYTVLSGSDGGYSFKGVPAGTYSLTAVMPGFSTYVRQGVKITGDGTAQSIAIKMIVGDQSVVINVVADENTVSVDPDKNASATVLTAKDLESFSDDPDELSSELSALAGPAAGPNGGQIYIDGFTGGQLPPKSSIREIRINQNPFSAEYDRPGFGRVEVFTKPGTDKFHGQYQLNGLDKAFNTGSPFIPASTPQPGYHSILMFGSVSGPIRKGASFTMNGSFRQIQNNSIVDPPAIYSTSQTSGVPCQPGQAGCQIYATLPSAAGSSVTYPGGNGFTFAQFSPQTRYDFGPRLDIALGEKNTLTARFQYEHNAQDNQGIGGNDLASTGYNTTSAETTIQISDTQIISSKIINETRFEFQRPTSSVTPFSTTPSINVQGAFGSGGNATQTETDVQPHIELQNYTSIALAKHFIRAGGRLRSTADQNTTTANSNGSFVYSSIGNYAQGVLEDFSITNIVHPTVNVTSVDLGLYAEDDWKIIPKLTLSYGLRYETQNYIHDHHDFAPRLAVAYGVGKKTVVRAGFGLFYDRFLPQNQLTVERNNGVNQLQQTAASSNFTTAQALAQFATCTPANITACKALTTSNELTINTIASNLRAPYQIQENLGVDQQLFRNATISMNYQHIRGVHQFFSNVPNYQTALASNQLDYNYESEGVFNQNQLILNGNVRGFHNLTLFGFYVLNYAKSDAAGINSFISTPNNAKADYGRASFDVRNRLFMGGSYSIPRILLTISPFLVAQSGNPYNITAGIDEFGTNVQNYRAVYANPGTVPDVTNGFVKTIHGCGTFATPGTLGNNTEVPINSCTGPAIFTLNLRVVKTIGFGPSTGPKQAQGGTPPGGPPGGGGGRSGGGGGRGPGGGGGFGGASSGKRYNLTIGAQAQNVFNVADRTSPVGVLSSPSFGTSTQLAGSLFTNDDAVRRIQLQVGFTF